MTETGYSLPPAMDHGPFLGFALRRVLRVVVAAILIVLLAGVVIVNDAGYQKMLWEEEMKACQRAAEQLRARYEPADVYLLACPWSPGRTYG